MGFPSGASVDESTAAVLRLWFQGRQRVLPWREADSRGLRDPYRTWIAEIMLQQTRVEAVVPYFNSFLDAFPKLEALAKAPLEEVLRLWAGLGYYRRARMLHAAAVHLHSELDGVWPRTAASLRVLPGIGTYTAAAIASLAFGERVAVVDGNVKRLLARLLALELASDDVQLEKASRQQVALWVEALPVAESHAAGELNEALMELGATLCRPRNPLCESCPVLARCQAHVAGREQELPLAKRSKKMVDLELVFLVQRVGVRALLRIRQQGWSPGLYEPPHAPLQQQDPEDIAANLLRRRGNSRQSLRYHGIVRHTITHHRIRAHVFTAPGPRASASLGKDWLDPATVALTGLATKVLRCSMN